MMVDPSLLRGGGSGGGGGLVLMVEPSARGLMLEPSVASLLRGGGGGRVVRSVGGRPRGRAGPGDHPAGEPQEPERKLPGGLRTFVRSSRWNRK
jgi:hypothetical protein